MSALLPLAVVGAMVAAAAVGTPGPRQVRSGGLYAGLRSLVHAVKRGDPQAFAEAARLLAPQLPRGAVLVPVPGSRGGSAAALELGRAIQRLRPDVQLVDALRGAARQSTRSRKKRGARPLAAQQMIMLRRREVRLPEGPVFLLDNVVDTGATIRAARRALGFDAPVAAIAHTGRHT